MWLVVDSLHTHGLHNRGAHRVRFLHIGDSLCIEVSDPDLSTVQLEVVLCFQKVLLDIGVWLCNTADNNGFDLLVDTYSKAVMNAVRDVEEVLAHRDVATIFILAEDLDHQVAVVVVESDAFVLLCGEQEITWRLHHGVVGFVLTLLVGKREVLLAEASVSDVLLCG